MNEHKDRYVTLVENHTHAGANIFTLLKQAWMVPSQLFKYSAAMTSKLDQTIGSGSVYSSK